MRVYAILAGKGADVATIPPDAAVLDVARALAHHRVGALVVADDGGGIAGIVSERDLARALAAGEPDVLAWPVTRVMTAEVLTCGPDDTVDHLMDVMTTRRIRHLPVVADGRLAGIVSIGDVVKHRLDELREENGLLYEYLHTGR